MGNISAGVAAQPARSTSRKERATWPGNLNSLDTQCFLLILADGMKVTMVIDWLTGSWAGASPGFSGRGAACCCSDSLSCILIFSRRHRSCAW